MWPLQTLTALTTSITNCHNSPFNTNHKSMELGTAPEAERKGYDLDRIPFSYQWRFNVCLTTIAMQATQAL